MRNLPGASPFKRLVPSVLVSLLGACSPGTALRTTTVDVPHSAARTQTLGNCWVYATVAWVESLVMGTGQPVPDFSEAYVTYRHFEDVLMGFSPRTPSAQRLLDASGTFASARALIAAHGVLSETDFPSFVEGISVEERAWKILSESLKTGPLARLFSLSEASARETLVRRELDAAFGVDRAFLERHAIPASQVRVQGSQGATTLERELGLWGYADFPLNMEDLPRASGPFPYLAALSEEQELILRRLKGALNRRLPVLVGWLVDDAALDGQGVFSSQTWSAQGKPGLQGLHLTVAVDYTASGIDPETGAPFRTEEGETPLPLRQLAQSYGRLDALILKNSWGPRPGQTYSRDGNLGFTRLEASYLLSWLPRVDGGSELVLRSMVLPQN